MQAVFKLFERFWRIQFLGYFVTCIGALAVDMGSFLLLLQTPVPPGLAAAIAYTLGIVAHWIILSRSVFEDGTADRGNGRTQQKALFLTTTWAGLALTTGIVAVADILAVDVILSKMVAVAVSFFLNYFIRKHFIFSASKRAA